MQYIPSLYLLLILLQCIFFEATSFPLHRGRLFVVVKFGYTVVIIGDVFGRYTGGMQHYLINFTVNPTVHPSMTIITEIVFCSCFCTCSYSLRAAAFASQSFFKDCSHRDPIQKVAAVKPQ